MKNRKTKIKKRTRAPRRRRPPGKPAPVRRRRRAFAASKPPLRRRRRDDGIDRHSAEDLPRVNAAATRALAAIRIGKRHRKDYGDLAELARSIEARGALLQPVVITPDNRLIAGERRLKAWRLTRFKRRPIPVHVVDIDAIIAGEWDENAYRKNFTPSETVAIKREIEIKLKALAAARMRAGKRADPAHKGQAGDQAARFAGAGRRTVEKAEQLVDAAAKDPKRFGRLKADMDRTGRVDGPFKRLQNMQAADRIKTEPSGLPMQGPYRTIVADPPWPADLDGYRDPAARGYYPYPTMSLADIAALPVASLAHAQGCALWLWIPNFHLARGCHVDILKRWGFEGSTLLTWVKPKLGQGQRLRGASEHCILAVRGEVPVLGTQVKTWFLAGGGRHSQKPAEFYAIVEKVTPAPRYAELFSRGGRSELWDCHGDQAGKFAAAAAPAPTAADKPKRQRKTPSEKAIDDATRKECRLPAAAAAPAGEPAAADESDTAIAAAGEDRPDPLGIPPDFDRRAPPQDEERRA